MPIETPDFPPARILVVDDTPDGLYLTRVILEDEGYAIQVAKDGMTALAEVKRWQPDLVVMDVMMPQMSGIEVTRILRQWSEPMFLPILLITAYDQASSVEGLDAGADDFVYKPVNVDELLARVRALLRLKKSVDAQVALSRQREDFMSRLTHDLRTPLIAVERVLNLIIDGSFGSLPEDAVTMLQRVVQTNHNLQIMADTLLEVQRHESGCKLMTPLPMDILKITTEVVEELSPLAQEKELQLNLEYKPEIATATVKGDQLEIRRILTNLVDNAIKFSDQGCIAINLFLDPMLDPSVLKLEVCDNGPGIPLAEQAVLFQRFHQGRHARSGYGLGLHLCRLIAEAHQGSLHCRSTVGEGSCFTLQLPLSRTMA